MFLLQFFTWIYSSYQLWEDLFLFSFWPFWYVEWAAWIAQRQLPQPMHTMLNQLRTIPLLPKQLENALNNWLVLQYLLKIMIALLKFFPLRLLPGYTTSPTPVLSSFLAMTTFPTPLPTLFYTSSTPFSWIEFTSQLNDQGIRNPTAYPNSCFFLPSSH